MNNNKRRVRVIFDFESLLDMKLGLISFMQEMFENAKDNEETKKKVNLELLYSDTFTDPYRSKYIHVYGWDDPIHAVLLGQAADQYKELTKQFFDECYEGIMNRAPMTAMVRLIRNYQITGNTIGAVKPSIMCTSDLQRSYCEKNIQGVPIVMVEERGKLNIDDYGTIVLPYIEMIVEFGLHVNFTNIYILNYRENFEPTDPTIPITKFAIAYGDTNGFNFYDAYPGLEAPVG